MPKAQKSSATSGTRKKHARKAADSEQQLPLPKEKKPKDKSKSKNKEPKVKVYVPPTKPMAVKPDPLDTRGIAKKLPPELVIVLRRLGKKDTVTKGKALEDLRTDWVLKAIVAETDYALNNAIQLSLPVWLHHVPSLLLHHSKRLRLQATELMTAYLRVPDFAQSFISFLRDEATSTEIEQLVGSWCMATQDIDKQASQSARKSWDLLFGPWSTSQDHQEQCDNLVLLDSAIVQPLLEFVKRAIYDPQGVYLELNPIQPSYVAPVHGGRGKPAPRSPQFDETPGRSKTEEEEESEQDRCARIRAGALGVIRWVLDQASSSNVDILPSSPAFWTALYHGSSPLFSDEEAAFGADQPIVRRTAWTIVSSLLKSHKKLIEAHFSTISTAILRSAWVEPQVTVRVVMWEPLLQFLTKYPSAWHESGKLSPPAGNDDDSGSDEDEDNAEDDATQERLEGSIAECKRKEGIIAYHEFLQFLQLGCNGSPTQGYPLIIVILSTIPSTILGNDPDSWLELFTSFWAASDGKALSSLDRAQSSAAFLSSLLECLVYLTKRSSIEQKDGASYEGVRHFIKDQFSRVWTELASRRLRVDDAEAGKALSRTLTGLGNIDSGFAFAAWEPITEYATVMVQSVTSSNESIDHLLNLLSSLKSSAIDVSKNELVHSLSRIILDSCLRPSDLTSDVSLSRLQFLISVFGDVLFVDTTGDPSRLDDLIYSDETISKPSLRSVYLQKRGHKDLGTALWHKCLISIVAASDSIGKELLQSYLDASERGLLPTYLRPLDDELDQHVTRLVSEAISSDEGDSIGIVKRLFCSPELFLSPRTVAGLIHSIAFAFADKYRALVRESSTNESRGSLQAPLHLLSSCIESRPNIVSSAEVREFLPDIFTFAFLSGVSSDARKIWDSALVNVTGEEKEELFNSIKKLLKDLLSDTDVCLSPLSLIAVASEEQTGMTFDLLNDLFPSREVLDEMLADLPSDPADYSLAVIDRLIPPASLWKMDGESLLSFDNSGYSEYARIVNTLSTIAMTDRGIARENLWLLPHFISLYIASKDALNMPSYTSAIFDKHVRQQDLEEIVTRVEMLAAFLLSDITDDSWHVVVVQSLIKNDASGLKDALGHFIFYFLSRSPDRDSVRYSRMTHFITCHLLKGSTTSDADLWMQYARQIEKKAPLSSAGIVLAVTESGLEPPRLERYRNELASGILSISPAKADTDGLLLLFRLAITAPSLDSDIIFLPQPRAVNFMKTCQQWVTSDDDIDEDVECEMLAVFQHLIPILQNVTGSHWDFIFDMIENNLETSSFSDQSSLTLLTRTFKLLQDIQSITQFNKALKALWLERETGLLSLVRDLVQNAQVVAQLSIPRAMCWKLALSIVQDLPSSLINEETLSKMVHVLGDPDVSILRMVYPLLQTAAAKRTEHVVIEAGVDSSEDAKFELPLELLELVQTLLDNSRTSMDGQNMFGYLLGWMTIFDLFNNASLRVKVSYASQLRDMNIISKQLLPTAFEFLGLYGGMKKPIQLEQWMLHEYYVQHYDEHAEISNNLLAAHLYYRALLNVPSLVASWWNECKDRQLSMAVASMTARHFSPVLISAELKHVTDPEVKASTSEENWNIKVSNTIHEVTAAFTVDEETMEIAIKLPADYPLHSVEVREVRRLGVDEKRWRSWLLAVQQIVTSQNGRIADGLDIFKRNITNHFENQTECAICYAIVSATELSLPKKRCRTCKNRFHAGCLYKWFNTSHTSSCPLCRSDFI